MRASRPRTFGLLGGRWGIQQKVQVKEGKVGMVVPRGAVGGMAVEGWWSGRGSK
jgi:hypothetical protein